ncbi:hypothetical protein SGPA1_40283 [Streptomyces misionensis JCM 4497]
MCGTERPPSRTAVLSPETINGRGGMTEDLQFDWELSGSGWAHCRVADGSAQRCGVPRGSGRFTEPR